VQVTGTINEIKDVLRERGPLYAHCSTEDWDDEECWPELASGGYVSLTDTSVCVPRRVGNCVNTEEFNHAVIIVGYGYDGGEGGAGDFWIVRNTLGPTYGHDGHIFVKATHSMLTCRLAYLRWENPSIVGEYWVEEGETNNYQVVHSQNSVSQFQWILSPSSLFNNQESGYDRSIDLIPNDNSSGLGNIAFTLSYPVGWVNDPKKTETLDKNIWVGQPFMPVITCTTQDPCASIKTYEVGDKLLNGAQDVIWSDDPPNLTFVEPTDIVNVRHVQILGEGTISCEFSNDAGSQTDYYNIWFECPTMTSYPNPADEVINIEVDNIENDSDIDTSLYNSKGEKNKEKKTKLKNHDLDVSDLPEGTYYLKVKVKSKDGQNVVLEQQVIII
jgi:hypothetical protein